MKIVFRLMIAFSCLSLTETSLAGKYGAEFLRLGVGARALGMGGAYVALVADGTAGYWNPAGLGNLSRHQVSLSYVQLFDNLASHHFANFAFKMPANMGLGISWIRLAVDDIPRYPELPGTRFDRILNPEWRSTGTPSGYFGDIEDALFLSFGKAIDLDLIFGSGLLPEILPLRLNVGVSYKLINQKLDTAVGRGQGIDLGVQATFFGSTNEAGAARWRLAFGLNLQDVAGTTIAWNTASHNRDRVSTTPIFGTAYSQWLPWLDGQMTLAMSRNFGFEPSNQAGFEFTFRNLLSVRTGMSDDSFTAGGGLRINRFRMDYAFVGYDLGNSHRISGAVEF